MVKHIKTKKNFKKKMRGGDIDYDTLPEYKSIHDIKPEEYLYYEGQYARKKSKANVNLQISYNAEQKTKKEARIQEIATNPNIKISTNEYERLIPQNQKSEWIVSHNIGSQRDPILIYKKKKPTDTVIGKLKALIEKNIFNFYLDEIQYNTLSENDKKQFISYTIDQGKGEKATRYRFITPEVKQYKNITTRLRELKNINPNNYTDNLDAEHTNLFTKRAKLSQYYIKDESLKPIMTIEL